MRPVVALVPAAGRGVRLGEPTPKAFVPVGGTPMVRLAVDGLIASGAVHRVVVVVPAELVEAASTLLSTTTSLTGGSMPPVPVQVVVGGAERTDSVRAGIAAAPDAAFYLVHDAARALTPPELIARVAAELQAGSQAVVPALPVVDTVKSVDDAGIVTGTPDRAHLRAIQTPQGFAADLLRRAYATDVGATDDAGLVERLGIAVHTVPGDPLAFKITTPLDLHLAEALLADASRSTAARHPGVDAPSVEQAVAR
ncbi:2-C-methyl-D-erythritol 4-phosphate cytidylyltransferase [Nocardia salmonicida]|uniref:2-C-methyl-D-erythritol 4-phosphate cytidylyltransferase n=1 Tax=Nocardia salmonicida TaxID=53431 RepID=UPI000A06A071|nr:2-C-methyl-D-erythritol 4-phosphate cytidylyltransferase [Nocardia salmonicida]